MDTSSLKYGQTISCHFKFSFETLFVDMFTISRLSRDEFMAYDKNNLFLQFL